MCTINAALTIYIDLLRSRLLGGRRRYILPSLSPSQPVIADENIICWGTFLNFYAFFAPQTQHSTAQSTPTSSKATTRRSEPDKASRQSWFEPTCRRAFIAVFSKRTKNSKYARPTKISNHCNHSQTSLGVMLPVHCSFSPSFLFRPCMQRPVRGRWSFWHLQVASLHLKPWTSLSASFIRILFNSCERA